MDIRNYFGVKPGGGKPANGSTGKTNTPRFVKNRIKYLGFLIYSLFSINVPECPSPFFIFMLTFLS
jgi:hypothetical protein